ncbi:hypothetical protein DERF_006131 [Dermatophagoides farinae]|uniref:Uncharacterized protein n=1 Tax=Dermatophagoides farinae TaxID=6954 RepID=A0A922L9E2_DERFA|nr:hypothetical protein DERF_006131 [Dermatophagoides farinae]
MKLLLFIIRQPSQKCFFFTFAIHVHMFRRLGLVGNECGTTMVIMKNISKQQQHKQKICDHNNYGI